MESGYSDNRRKAWTGQYDIMHVGIEASMDDKFACALNHELEPGVCVIENKLVVKN